MTRPVLLTAIALTFSLALAGCSSSSTASSSASASTGAGSSTAASAAASASPGTTASADPVLQWCVAYTQITDSLSQADSSKEGAQTSLNALGAFDQLWAAGGNLGYISTEESDANRRAVVAYAALVTQVVAGKTDKDQEVIDAQANLTKVTTADQKLLESSATKVSALCGPLTADPVPSGGSGAPSAPASPAPSDS
jgi:hypothetical protein